jgi:pimeloyl-ACP methyl ester carboxylesterase
MPERDHRLRRALTAIGVVSAILSTAVAFRIAIHAATPRETNWQRGAGPTSPQVRAVAAVHRAGQTFVTWRELDPMPKSEMTMPELNALAQELGDKRRIRYRIYRSAQPILKLADAVLVGEVRPLAAWDATYFGVYPPADARPPRYVIEDGKPPLASGTGLMVHNPAAPGPAYYAVTVSVAGVENTSITADNVTAAAMTETVGPGAPVLQRVDTPNVFQYIERPTLRAYVRWETGTNSPVAGKPFNYLVAISSHVRYPAPVGIHLHAWGANMYQDFGWWFNAEKGAILVSSTQVPYDWWTGYHERLWQGLATADDWKRGVVRPYTTARLFSFVDWLATTMKLDLTRVFSGGNSMGGSGAIMMAIRYPTRIAWAISWVGVHSPADSPFKSSYELVYGKPEFGARFENGTPVWDYYNNALYLRQHPQDAVPFLTFSNGKNDDSIGWPQAVTFFRALQETRQPHLFVWGQQGHNQRAVMPIDNGERENPLDLRTNQSLPAFTRCTLDDDPGNGAATSGAPQGQANAFLYWRTETIQDEPNRWSVVIALSEKSPKPAAAVDVTPRRLQQFKLKPGDRVEWTNSAGSAIVQRGEAVADQWGLVTLPQMQVTRGGNRLAITRAQRPQ